MGQVLHGSATTTKAVRRSRTRESRKPESPGAPLQSEPENGAQVAPAQLRHRPQDWPSHPRSTVLSLEQEAVIVAFRRHTLLPLDDCLYALQAMIPALRRSSLHRCLERHGISRLPEVEGDKPAKEKFHSYPIGFFHVDVAELRSAGGKLYLFMAIDRTSKFAFVELLDRADMATASAFLEALMEAAPHQIHTVLTDNGIQFAVSAEEPQRTDSQVPRPPFRPRLLPTWNRASAD